jgi:hypothetical protein
MSEIINICIHEQFYLCQNPNCSFFLSVLTFTCDALKQQHCFSRAMALLRPSDVITAVTLVLNALALLSTSSRPQQPSNSRGSQASGRTISPAQCKEGNHGCESMQKAPSTLGSTSAPYDTCVISNQGTIDPLLVPPLLRDPPDAALPMVSRVGDLLRTVRSITVFLLAWNAIYLVLMLFVFS